MARISQNDKCIVIMRNKVLNLQQILAPIQDYLITVYGPQDGVSIDNLADATHVTESTLDWVNSSKR